MNVDLYYIIKSAHDKLPAGSSFCWSDYSQIHCVVIIIIIIIM